MVPKLLDIEIIDADATSERGNHGLDFVATEHLVEASLFNVQNLALDRQNRLKPSISSLFRGTSGRLALHDVNFASGRIPFLAVGELAGQAAAV